MSKEKPKLDFKKFSKAERDYFLNEFLPNIESQVREAGGIEGFLKVNKHLAHQFKEISLKSRDNITKSVPETFPELGITQEELKESYEKQLEILDTLITPPEQKLTEDGINIMGENIIDKSE